MQDLKMQDMKLKDQFAGHENARHKNFMSCIFILRDMKLQDSAKCKICSLL